MGKQVKAGDYMDQNLSKQDRMNLLTALMPDLNGNILFTSRHGLVGMLSRNELTEDGCIKAFAIYIGSLA